MYSLNSPLFEGEWRSRDAEQGFGEDLRRRVGKGMVKSAGKGIETMVGMLADTMWNVVGLGEDDERVRGDGEHT